MYSYEKARELWSHTQALKKVIELADIKRKLFQIHIFGKLKETKTRGRKES